MIDKKNCKYKTEVLLYGYNKEKVEKELASIDNRPLKEALKEYYHRAYAYQFYFSSNSSHIDNLEDLEEIINDELSEKGRVAIVRKYDENGKAHYIPASIKSISYDSKKKHKIRKLSIEYYYNHQQENLTNSDDYQIIFNNPKGESDLIEFEKDFDLLVSIQDEMSKQIINQYPCVILESSRPLKAEEIEEFKNQWEGKNYTIFLPPGVNSVKDGRPPLKTDELLEKFESVRKELDKKIENDIRENKDIKYKERKKAFKEIEKKWGIKIELCKR